MIKVSRVLWNHIVVVHSRPVHSHFILRRESVRGWCFLRYHVGIYVCLRNLNKKNWKFRKIFVRWKVQNMIWFSVKCRNPLNFQNRVPFFAPLPLAPLEKFSFIMAKFRVRESFSLFILFLNFCFVRNLTVDIGDAPFAPSDGWSSLVSSGGERILSRRERDADAFNDVYMKVRSCKFSHHTSHIQISSIYSIHPKMNIT